MLRRLLAGQAGPFPADHPTNHIYRVFKAQISQLLAGYAAPAAGATDKDYLSIFG
jgi:hypothetical protein